MTAPTSTHFLVAARDLASLVRAGAARAEERGQIDDEVARALSDAGLFRMAVPSEIGGGEADPESVIESIDAISQADGSAGWVMMIGATTGFTAFQLPRRGAEEVFGSPDGLTVGAVAPRGRATRTDGGFRVTGTWPFGSGSAHATWIAGGAIVFSADGPEMLSENVPHVRNMFFPAHETIAKDTWHVSGLKGTGSNDFEVTDAIVPEHRSCQMGSTGDWADGRLYRFPLFGLFALGVAAVATGIGRAAIDELTELAKAKTPTGSRRLLAERAAAQEGGARAEALVRSGRSFMLDAIRAVWAKVKEGEKPTLQDRALLRLAATTGAMNAAAAVDICYNLGGATSIYSENALQRHFRDVHVVTQHIMVGQPTIEVAGRVFFGIPTDSSAL